MIEALNQEPDRLRESRLSKIKDLFIAHSDPLDDTRARAPYRRDEDPGTFRASSNGINIPTAIFIFLIVQFSGFIWSYANLQSKSNELDRRTAKIEQILEEADLRGMQRETTRTDSRVDDIESWIKLTREQLARKGL